MSLTLLSEVISDNIDVLFNCAMKAYRQAVARQHHIVFSSKQRTALSVLVARHWFHCCCCYYCCFYYDCCCAVNGHPSRACLPLLPPVQTRVGLWPTLAKEVSWLTLKPGSAPPADITIACLIYCSWPLWIRHALRDEHLLLILFCYSQVIFVMYN